MLSSAKRAKKGQWAVLEMGEGAGIVSVGAGSAGDAVVEAGVIRFYYSVFGLNKSKPRHILCGGADLTESAFENYADFLLERRRPRMTMPTRPAPPVSANVTMPGSGTGGGALLKLDANVPVLAAVKERT